ncbi:uncharacterized protein LACBIDRAFT_318552 [Laccaria bicolor S238N-H82]|uniref:Predicted protein n=1 Tax=Laccaria bicolor (strain S238N-H82 / ATCC MYA-4686) TaxID=486041 RepID=B0E2M8_LACBS|nr:uncharacterized protein LACBIDRAFT_318552 [Laccaria bicolor S238N-H82]EDQ98905.1 predicted protein [Laccaria bicolor S238N-H82]|eukprot:XP_001890450.1 predicted protein [Laccaria bicolor S238N-H82]
MQPSNVGGTKVFAWKKFAMCAAFLVEVMWFRGLGEDTFFWRGNGNTDLDAEGYQTDTAPSPSKTHHQQTQQPTTPVTCRPRSKARPRFLRI